MRAPRWLTRRFGHAEAPPPSAAPQPPPLPVDRDRVGQCLTARGYRYVVDPDGDLTGTWNAHRFWFLLLGDHHDVVQVRGRWSRTLAPGQRGPALLALNDWNRERIWPKSYLREEDGRLAVYAEISVDLEAGATDDQLDQILTCGLGTSVQLFKSLDNQVGDDPV